MTPPFNTEPFVKLHQAQVDSLQALANAAFAGAERFAVLNLNTSRSLLEDSANSARTLLGAHSLQDFIARQGALTQPALDKALAWSRDAREIGSSTQEALTEVLEAGYAEASQSLDTALDTLVQHAPAGAEVAVGASVSALKSAIAVAASAYDSLSTAAKQADAAIKPTAKRRKT